MLLLSLNSRKVGRECTQGPTIPPSARPSKSDHCSSLGLPRRLRSTSLLWKGSTQEALNLLKDDVLVVDPGTR